MVTSDEVQGGRRAVTLGWTQLENCMGKPAGTRALTVPDPCQPIPAKPMGWWSRWETSGQAQIDLVEVGHEQLCLN